MNAATFRWRPGLLFLWFAVFEWALVLAVVVGIPFATGKVLPFAWAFSPFLILPVVMFAALGHQRLAIDENGISLRTGANPRWTIRWSELLEVRYERGTALKWNHLVLRTASGTKRVILNDRLAGRWNDPQEVVSLLRRRGYEI